MVSENSPPLGSLRRLGATYDAGLELVLEPMGIARMLIVMAWWRMRSWMAVAMVRSPKTSPMVAKTRGAALPGSLTEARTKG